MNEIKRPTLESIEAALSAYEPIADDRTGEFSDDTKTFLNFVFQNERLRLEFLGIVNAVGCPEGFDPSDWQGLAKAGYVNPELMQKVMTVMDMFFWIGWHARGAIEEADQLKRMTE